MKLEIKNAGQWQTIATNARKSFSTRYLDEPDDVAYDFSLPPSAPAHEIVRTLHSTGEPVPVRAGGVEHVCEVVRFRPLGDGPSKVRMIVLWTVT